MALDAMYGSQRYNGRIVNAPGPDLRERARRAVLKEITDAANRLFIEHGYETTTIDDIARAVGMSRRSVFRYFPTKEDIGVFDLLVPYVDAPGRQEVAEPMQRVVFATPALFARYLQKLQRMQDAAEQALRERAALSHRPYGADDPTPRAIVGAAFGCLLAAQHAWLAGGATATFADTIDRAMASVGPRT
jgi:AcrR family transcriptional regulator